MHKANSSCIFRRSTNWLDFYSCFSFWWSLEKPFLKLGLDFGAFHRLRSELTISGQSLRPDFERSDQGPIRPSLLSSASKTDSFFKSKSELWNNKGSEIKKSIVVLSVLKSIFFSRSVSSHPLKKNWACIFYFCQARANSVFSDLIEWQCVDRTKQDAGGLLWFFCPVRCRHVWR